MEDYKFHAIICWVGFNGSAVMGKLSGDTWSAFYFVAIIWFVIMALWYYQGAKSKKKTDRGSA
jgi:hypothetical protein